ncbi:MAG TPA: DUF6703 family protein [Streptosporangiaceae bacterium]
MTSKRPGQSRQPRQQQARPGRQPGRGGRGRRPLPRGQALYTPDASPARRSVEQASARPLALLYQLPVWLPPVLAVALLIAGLAMRGPAGAVALCAMAAVLAWLAFVSWPALGSQGKATRVLAIACVLALAGWQATR